ncbi:alpha/beta hydrolase family esterase [Dichotomicrobium thermohalophilum]|uniref:Polyhydroxybutyrate depolymerase n=1 Tax=Dichotomicrobium thermohalophilum TaxID=933063 RepID=A0A397Q8G0_9HYPH|nr:PHB depolymerase family esterase [Dichotomicrobium thermohalophilum]RIA56799.1 polyhydroxybutyrate depolymerase [Dichotomicrobium thermohalophilum]
MSQARLGAVLVAALVVAMLGPRAEAREFYGETVVDGVPRTYTVFVPDSARDRGDSVPVVIVLHGGRGDGARVRRIMGLDRVAEREGFATVYPDSLGRGWNDGRRFRRERSDDVAFLLRLKKSLVRRGLADPDRVFVAGVSNGGMMVQRLACEVPGAFAGYASIIANMPVPVIDRCLPDRPVPMMVINGTDDRLMPYDGGDVGLRGRRGAVVSAFETVEFWRAHNGCDGRPGRRMLPNRDPRDGSRVVMFYSTDCRGAPVIHLRVEGGGHRVPGSPVQDLRFMAERVLGAQNNDISTAEVITRFFAGLDRTS